MILLCRLEVEYPRMHHRLEKTTFIYIFFTDFWGVLFSVTTSVVISMIEWDQDQFIMS